MNDEVIITPNKGLFDLQLNRVLRYKNLMYMLVKRDFITYYKQTILGPMWYVISPVLSTIMYIIVFGNLAGIGTDSIPQPLFYFSGTMLWTFFSNNLLKSSNTFIQNKDLFGKVYFPRIIVPISNVIGNLMKLTIQFVLFVIVFIYYIVVGVIHYSGFKILLFVPCIAWIAIVAVGLGMIISSVTTKYRDLAMALEFIISLLMYATPVVYPISEVSGKLRVVLCLNPVSAPIEVFRYAFFGESSIPVWSIVYSIIMSIVILFVGIIAFNQNEQTFIDVI